MSAEVEVLDCEPPTADVIERLEEVLAAAKRGSVSAVAIAIVYRDGSTGDAWSKPHSTATLAGAAFILTQRLGRLLTDKD